MTEDEEHVLFLRHMGAAIAKWSNVERGIAGCVLSCVPDANFDPLAAGFLSIENFRSKLAFANELVTAKIAGTRHTKDWEKLLERTKTLSAVRNKIAHRVTRQFPNGKPGRRILLCPWELKISDLQSEVQKPPAGSISLLDVVRAGLDFDALGFSLANFSNRINGDPERFPKSCEQPGNLPSIQALVRQIHAVLGHPKKQ